MAAQTDENGVLAQIVQQVSDNSPYVDQSKSELIEKWKGPYSIMKDYPCGQFKPGKLRTACIPQNALTCIAVPQAPDGKSWIVDSVKIQEIEAGDHCIMTVKYYSDYLNSGGGGESSAIDDEKDDIWTLSWQSYSVSPFRYCKNDYSKPAPTPKDQNQKLDVPACRGRIESYIHYRTLPAKDTYVSSNYDWCYKVPSAKATSDLSAGVYCLSKHEREIYKKVSDGQQPIFHYPVLTHQTSKYYTGDDLSSIKDKTYPDNIGENIDTKSDLPRGCPYTFGNSPTGNAWEWIKTGDTMVQVKTNNKNKFTRIETWEGSLSVDVDFYGVQDRWMFGQR